MKVYNFFSNLQPNYFNHLKHLLLSLKMFKSLDAVYNYVVALDVLSLKCLSYTKQLEMLESDDFHVTLYSSKIYLQYIKLDPYTLFIRCLLPSICENIDKILFLDTDMLVLNNGIEHLYDINFNDYYIAAVNDLIILDTLRKQCQTYNYFNCGVLLFNIKKIKLDGMNKILKLCLLQYPTEIKPTFRDQTLLNYILRDKVLLIPPIYNNTLSAISKFNVPVFRQVYKHYGYEEPIDSLNDTIILHFAGTKVWNKITPEEDSIMLYYRDIRKFYYNFLKKLLDFEHFLLSK